MGPGSSWCAHDALIRTSGSRLAMPGSGARTGRLRDGHARGHGCRGGSRATAAGRVSQAGDRLGRDPTDDPTSHTNASKILRPGFFDLIPFLG